MVDQPEEPDREITVVGQKWSWSFNYMGEDAVSGKNVVFRYIGMPEMPEDKLVAAVRHEMKWPVLQAALVGSMTTVGTIIAVGVQDCTWFIMNATCTSATTPARTSEPAAKPSAW